MEGEPSNPSHEHHKIKYGTAGVPTDNGSPLSDTGPKATPDVNMPCGHHKMNCRNLIVCIDGTSNQFGVKNTNVIEIYSLILKEVQHNQRTWYNSGIGTYARPSWISPAFLKKVIFHHVDLAIAWDFERTVLGAYRWLSDNYEPGDCIFLFGFSRGAFQVRVLSAMIDKVGLIYKGNEMQIPFAYELYADPKTDQRTVTQVGSEEKTEPEENVSMAERFKIAFSHQGVKVHFVGAWDTVSSIGIARGKRMLPRTIDGMKHVCYFRHALALDERRVKFLPEYAYGGAGPKQDDRKDSMERLPQTMEVWFAGTHSDIGGGNVQNAGMNRSRPPLRWMVFEAGKVGLRTARFKRELNSNEQIEIKESLKGIWWLFEVIPFKRLTFTRRPQGGKSTTHWFHFGSPRKIQLGQKIHSSLLLADRTHPDIVSNKSSAQDGVDGTKYIPKARPWEDDQSFWGMLNRNFNQEWLEVDLYKYVETVVESFISELHDTTLQTLREIATSGDGRQAVYEKVIEALSKKRETDLTIEVKYRLLRSALTILGSYSLDGPHLKLSPPTRIRPLVLDFWKSGNKEYRTVMQEFVARLTDPCLLVLQGRGYGIISAAFSYDGKRIVSGSSDSAVRIWDAETGKLLEVPSQGQSNVATFFAFSSDGKRVVSGSGDKTVRIWDAETGRLAGNLFEGHTSPVTSVAFSPDCQHIVCGTRDKTVRIWDPEKGNLVGEPFRGHADQVLSVAFSPDGKHIVSSSLDETVRIWDVKTGDLERELIRGHTHPVMSVAFSPDGNRIASGSGDKTIQIWDAMNGSLMGDPFRGHTDQVISVAFSSDGKRIVSSSLDETVRIWDVETGKLMWEPFRGHKKELNSVAFSSNGMHVVSSAESHENLKAVQILDAGTRKPLGEPFRGHTDSVRSVAFSCDGMRVVSGSQDKTVRIWDAETGVFPSDSNNIVSSSLDETVRIWDVVTGGHREEVNSVAFLSDGTRVVSSIHENSETVRILHAGTGKQLGEPFRGHTDSVRSVAFSCDGMRVVSGSQDKTVRVWDAEAGVFLSDSNNIVSNSSLDEAVRIWDVVTRGHKEVNSMSVSSDGTCIVSSLHDSTFRIWDAKTGNPVGEVFRGHTDSVRSVAFSSDGKCVVSGSQDNTVRIWDAERH